MKHLNNYKSFSINEQRTLAALDELCYFDEVNEGFMDWIKKIGQFFEKINDSIKSLMLTMIEKEWMAMNVVKKFIDKVLEKIKGFKEKHPVLFRTVILTLVLIIILFTLCSAASGKDAVPSQQVLDMAIGALKEIQSQGTDHHDKFFNSGTIMKAQAYLFELKSTGKPVTNPAFGNDAIALARGTLKMVQKSLVEYKNMTDGQEKTNQASYLYDLAQTGSKMVSYKIVEYQNALTKQYSGEDISVVFKK
jgi:hypothetical protein